ncbi:MAG: electron transport complex subunit RsxC [Chitinispirillaceae bacterium]|nr:electron transport complex subunit RsxC [Chitinispirillaceae bacterium]
MPVKFTFKGGVFVPHHKKKTEKLPIELFPTPAKIVIPLSQHIGTPAKPLVKRGDRVLVGQIIGEAGGYVSAPVHSSVSGTVASVGAFPHPSGKMITSVEIDNDGKDESVNFSSPYSKNWRETASAELVSYIQSAGIVGMGGAGFPTHVKLSPPSNKPIDTLIINGAECEPYLTADHRLMLEKKEELIEGVLILRKILGVKKCYIGIEDNKNDVIKEISRTLSEKKIKEISLTVLHTKYPQGGEKQLIKAITGREVPTGGLPMDVGCVVQNVGTTVAVYEAIVKGIPLYQRVVTISGPVIGNPKNFLVKIGTSVKDLLLACGVKLERIKKVIMGGPMMGLALSDLNVPVIKTTSGILALDNITPQTKLYPCVNCGRCLEVCPINLLPSRLAKLVERGDYNMADCFNIMDCIECGSCAYICPAKINLVHWIKLGKYHVTAVRKVAENKKP